jgi:hypothetical protein
MSDAAPTSAAATGGSAQFTERELQMLGWAMQSLKTGPPEVRTSTLPYTHHPTNALQDRLREARRLRRHGQPALRQQRLGQNQEQAWQRRRHCARDAQEGRRTQEGHW